MRRIFRRQKSIKQQDCPDVKITSQTSTSVSQEGFFSECTRPLKYTADSIINSRDRVVDEYKDFRLWFKDPIARSQAPHYSRHSYNRIDQQSATKPLRLPTLPYKMSDLSIDEAWDHATNPDVVSSHLTISPPSVEHQPIAPQMTPTGHNYFEVRPVNQQHAQRPTFERRATNVSLVSRPDAIDLVKDQPQASDEERGIISPRQRRTAERTLVMM